MRSTLAFWVSVALARVYKRGTWRASASGSSTIVRMEREVLVDCLVSMY